MRTLCLLVVLAVAMSGVLAGDPDWFLAVNWHFQDSLAFHVNAVTGERVMLGPTGFAGLNALARNSAGVVHSMGFDGQDDVLITIDPDTGAGTCNLACIGRTDAGTRFWIDSSMDTPGTRLSLEQLRELEAAFQGFRRPEAVDPSETVIRVYDADGKTYEERKVRFSALPRDFVFDAQRRSQKTASYSIPDEALDAATRSSLAAGGLDPRSFFPIQLAPTLAVSGPCQ
jgi:hypothetical protein